MSVPTWQPGTLYQPNALVVPLTAPPVEASELENGNFEGSGGWTASGSPTWSITSGTGFDGTKHAQLGAGNGTTAVFNNDNAVPVTPGQSITGTAKINTTGNSGSTGGASIKIFWFNGSSEFISASDGNLVTGGGDSWYTSTVTGAAPAGAATAVFAISGYRNSGSHNIYADVCSWDYVAANAPDGLIFKAVQTDAAYSASSEPVWPTTLGVTVVDGGVTWEAVLTTRVTWEASPILVSGSTEPTFPTSIGALVADNTIGWKAISRRIEDSRCPNTTPVAIAASKVFAGDEDIIAFCATIKPLDWSTADDAGYLPFGLQTYGSQPVSALGLYRGNLVGFNAAGFQMWQVDEDPANMALLDSVPVSCTFPRTVQPLANDLLFLNAKGIRNISIAGASTNLQADGVGEPIDPLVRAQILADVYEPIGLYWPFMGQYWCIFGTEAFVLTINGARAKSWSRYTFPAAITDWALDGNDLVLRAGDTVWRMDEETTLDDAQDPVAVFTVGEVGRPFLQDYAFVAGAASNPQIGMQFAPQGFVSFSGADTFTVDGVSYPNVFEPTGEWFSDSAIPTFDPDDYDIRLTVNSGFDPAGIGGSQLKDIWYNIGTTGGSNGPIWNYVGSGDESASWTVQIRDALTLVVLASATYLIELEV